MMYFFNLDISGEVFLLFVQVLLVQVLLLQFLLQVAHGIMVLGIQVPMVILTIIILVVLIPLVLEMDKMVLQIVNVRLQVIGQKPQLLKFHLQD